MKAQSGFIVMDYTMPFYSKYTRNLNPSTTKRDYSRFYFVLLGE